MKKPRVDYRPPATLLGVIGRFYPLIMLAIALPIATQIGGIAGHSDPVLGSPIVPHLYPPFAAGGWIAAFAHENSQALTSAVTAVLWTLLGCFMLTVIQMAIDFSHGRSFGPFNFVFVIFSLWADLDTTLRGFPSSFTWWGSGGMLDRAKTDRENVRK